uniref:C-type lectin domain-containing protein n=1 Tax=Plectus sambesii TaxID=2011161 RepID=A0A914UIC0_9BILA
MVKTAVKAEVAKGKCNHYLGYSGHLVHIRNVVVLAAVKQLISTYGTSTDYIWTGMEPINASAAVTANNWANYYRNGTSVSPTYLPWAPSNPAAINRAYYQPSSDRIFAQSGYPTYYYICEYEEALKQPVTDLEKRCVNLTSPLVASFVNDDCYVLHPETKYYSDAKVACNDLSGYNGHLAHPRTMGDLRVANGLLLATGVTFARLGIEHTNTSSTDMTSGWYLTTPRNQSELATFLPWMPSTPLPVRHTLAKLWHQQQRLEEEAQCQNLITTASATSPIIIIG